MRAIYVVELPCTTWAVRKRIEPGKGEERRPAKRDALTKLLSVFFSVQSVVQLLMLESCALDHNRHSRSGWHRQNVHTD
jgi:hypothetical protein